MNPLVLLHQAGGLLDGAAPAIGDGKVGRGAQQAQIHNISPAPTDEGGIEFVRLEPRLGGMGGGGERIGPDLPPAVHTPATGEVPARANHAGCRRGAGILQGNRSRLIAERLVHVPSAQIAIGFIEDGRAIRLAGGIALTPIQGNFLPRIAGDGRNAHPDGGGSGGGIPVIDLIGQRQSGAGSEAEVLALGLGFVETEPVLVQADEDREVGLLGRGGQIRTIRRG